jgi:hypothetical protein
MGHIEIAAPAPSQTVNFSTAVTERSKTLSIAPKTSPLKRLNTLDGPPQGVC